jgi:hypothetical protein
MRASELIGLCRECAGEIYGTRRPSPEYAEAVARLLMGTAATESLLVHRRQMGFDMARDSGAWGLWQTEAAPLGDAMRYLTANPAVRERCAMFLFGPDRHDMSGIMAMGSHGLLRMIHDWDRMAVLFARLHYIRFAEAVPRTTAAQAEYWKRYYNTRLGKGTPEKYLKHWRELIAPRLEVAT